MAGETETQARSAPRRLFVGSYTDGDANEGIYTLAFDRAAAQLRLEHVGGRGSNPSYIVRHGSHLYAAHELENRGRLAAYALKDGGELTCCGACTSPLDAGTCFVAAHPSGRCLYGANYLSGSVTLCLLDASGIPSGGLPSLHHTEHGPNRMRQEAPHVHSACFVPGTNLLAVVDLGGDTVVLYHVNGAGTLETPPVETVRVTPGAGPRMLAFHPHLPLAALVAELTNVVLLYHFDATGRHWEAAGCLKLPVAPGDVRAAHPAFSPDGRHLYVSVRGSDCLSIFAVNEQGTVAHRDDVPTEGKGPRHFSLSHAGDYLALANTDSNEVVMFALNAATGTPCAVARLGIPHPSCVIWDE